MSVEDLYSAIRRCARAEVERLLTADPTLLHASPAGPAGYGPRTPLEAAVREDSAELVQLLLRLGADPNWRPSGDYYSTPLQAAAHAGRLDLVELLLQAGADPNLANSVGVTPLDSALMAQDRTGRQTVVKRLLKAGANVHVGSRGSPLWHAAAAGDVPLLEVLAAADADTTPAALVRPLFAAVRYDRPAAVSWFLAHGADPSVPCSADWDDAQGMTPLEYAHRLRHHKVVAALEEPAARPKRRRIPRTWEAILEELKEQHPALAKSFGRPATEAALAKVERLLGRTLPESLRSFYLLTNGQKETAEATLIQPPGSLDTGYRLLTLNEVADHWKQMNELVESGEFAESAGAPDRGIRPDWWSPGWLPVATNGGGDYFCVDLDPARGGVVGQVLHFSHEGPRRPRVARSFEAWLLDEYRRFLESR